MEYVWWIVVLATMVVYPVALIRGAVKGKRWALETLEALRYVGGDMMTTSAWRSLPLEPRPPEPPADAGSEDDQDDQDERGEGGRLVA